MTDFSCASSPGQGQARTRLTALHESSSYQPSSTFRGKNETNHEIGAHHPRILLRGKAALRCSGKMAGVTKDQVEVPELVSGRSAATRAYQEEGAACSCCGASGGVARTRNIFTNSSVL